MSWEIIPLILSLIKGKICIDQINKMPLSSQTEAPADIQRLVPGCFECCILFSLLVWILIFDDFGRHSAYHSVIR